jgi:S1-C subfamily serine protease
MQKFPCLNKALFAGAAAVAALAIFFAYSQFNTLDFSAPQLPDLTGVTIPVATDNRDGLADDAFKIGKVSTVEAADQELSPPDLYERTEGSVVQLSSSSSGEGSRLGTGFVFDDNGHIVTNHHVAEGSDDLNVTFVDGTIYSATVIGDDPYTDLSVLYVKDVPKEKLAPLPLADSTKARVGESVAAIGNPFGLSSSMTSGIISGTGRLIPSQEGGALQFFIPDIIQTDAAINPGNSGGPLLNTRGQVVGINTAIRSSTGAFEGIGFAVPSNTIAKIVPTLIEKGSFQHPWVGISGTDMTPALAKALGIEDEPRGVLVVEVVQGSPADKAGIREGNRDTNVDGRNITLGGDIMLEIDGNPVRKLDDILVYLQREKTVGDTLDVTILRDGQLKNVQILLEARPAQQQQQQLTSP